MSCIWQNNVAASPLSCCWQDRGTEERLKASDEYILLSCLFLLQLQLSFGLFVLFQISISSLPVFTFSASIEFAFLIQPQSVFCCTITPSSSLLVLWYFFFRLKPAAALWYLLFQVFLRQQGHSNGLGKVYVCADSWELWTTQQSGRKSWTMNEMYL